MSSKLVFPRKIWHQATAAQLCNPSSLQLQDNMTLTFTRTKAILLSINSLALPYRPTWFRKV